VDLGRFRVGLRFDDVIRAADFYRGLGFTDVGSVPWIGRRPSHGDAPTPREAVIQAGPRGLGVAIGLRVDDLETAYRWYREAGCEITAEPRNEPYA
jgi:hypothetical protein